MGSPHTIANTHWPACGDVADRLDLVPSRTIETQQVNAVHSVTMCPLPRIVSWFARWYLQG